MEMEASIFYSLFKVAAKIFKNIFFSSQKGKALTKSLATNIREINTSSNL